MKIPRCRYVWCNTSGVHEHDGRTYQTPVVQPIGPCGCECSHGGFCGGCGHAGCGGRQGLTVR